MARSFHVGECSDNTLATGGMRYAAIKVAIQSNVAYQTYLFLKTSDLKNDFELSEVILNT